MPNYNEIQKIILDNKTLAQDMLRKQYLSELSKHLDADVILYMADTTNRNLPAEIQMRMGIELEDVTSFMTALSGLHTDKRDLFLIIHSSGGSLEATEQIVSYLRQKYNNRKITAIIPQYAMSAATLLACSCDEIIMGKQSAIGPIDPQFNGIPAQAILSEFTKAEKEISENPKVAPLWLDRIRKLPFGILTICEETSNLSKIKVEKWLSSYMFKTDSREEAKSKAEEIANWLGDYKNHKTHGHPISIKEALEHKLKIKLLEEDSKLQDLVLSIFHTTMLSFSLSSYIKIVENHNGQGRYLNFEFNRR